VQERRRKRLDVGELLAAVENAPPVAAADVVGELLAQTLDASEVAFLIADFAGDALIRLSHTGTGVMCFDWRGGSPRLRTSHSGADASAQGTRAQMPA
jgi:hypothetical protein